MIVQISKTSQSGVQWVRMRIKQKKSVIIKDVDVQQALLYA